MRFAGPTVLASRRGARCPGQQEAGGLNQSLADLATSYVHTHVNRFIRSAARATS
jgi:hypothetical protein